MAKFFAQSNMTLHATSLHIFEINLVQIIEFWNRAVARFYINFQTHKSSNAEGIKRET